MILGHLGVAAAVHRWRPRVSLWWLVPASVAPDMVDVAWALAGRCNPYGLYSHTVPAAVLLGACIAGAAVLAGRREAAALMFLMVLLHLPPDLVTGRKLYWPGGELHGLGLYNHRLADFVVEALVLVAGWALLRRDATTPRWAATAWALAGLVLLQGAADAIGGLKPSGCVPSRRAAVTVAAPWSW